MDETSRHQLPRPLIDRKEEKLLASLDKRYAKLLKPGLSERIIGGFAKRVPQAIKDLGAGAKDLITAQDLYENALDVIGTGFSVVQEQTARLSINEGKIVESVNRATKGEEISSLGEVCLARGYDVASVASKNRLENLAAALVEGAATGAAGFAGVPFSLVFSTFLFFRAVQIIATSYGYDVKGDAAEMEIAGQVFANAMDPGSTDGLGALGATMDLFMGAPTPTPKAITASSWEDLALSSKAGRLVVQMRELAGGLAQQEGSGAGSQGDGQELAEGDAQQDAGRAGFETTVFEHMFEQVGHKLALRVAQRAVPLVSGVIGAVFDTGQMQGVIDYADIFYAKRYLVEKDVRVRALIGA